MIKNGSLLVISPSRSRIQVLPHSRWMKIALLRTGITKDPLEKEHRYAYSPIFATAQLA
jgi:hypothetical protein